MDQTQLKHVEIIATNTVLSGAAKANIEQWLTEDKFSIYKVELEALIDAEDWVTLEDNFFQVIPFGTGGRRGTTGVGSNRINKVTIGEAVQALCNYIKELYANEAELSIVIAYDSRLTSVEFSDYAASVCAANGVKAYLYDDVRSTPQLSFSVRELSTDAGIVISASHNPSTDNGIKVYWKDGGQLVPPFDSELLSRCKSVAKIYTTDADEAKANGKIVMVGQKLDDAYIGAVLAQSLTGDRGVVIAYSPLHGAGMSNAYPALTKAGFDVRLYEPQSNYDGNFTNVTNNIPNPEVPAANDKVSAFMLEQNADIAITNDPDADRLGVVVNNNGVAEQINGNQIATLLCHYILQTRKNAGTLHDKQFIAKTIVTTDMLGVLADHYSVRMRGNLLVGFKYIGELIHKYCDNGDEQFIFGGEESYGALVGDYCRDKDAAGAALLIAELTATTKKEGKTLLAKLDELYMQYGFFGETLDFVMFPGAAGFDTMKQFMHDLRNSPPKTLGGLTVVKIRDYLPGEEIIGRPEDMLRFELSDDARTRVTVRPSGTEPKLKFYTQMHIADVSDLGQAKAKGTELAKSIVADMLALVP